ncbi:hypothetical protein B0T19DRAFT_438197 [Cercophora scortea]|uniref:Uncharacterized protein n=1 Tax=Cercophora scortea TaxID=314031 RepID=A0AAE0J6L9_9PEZI|nr:hypothetical protein B0T19DRAFT_438197 [Cercophora scortea]
MSQQQPSRTFEGFSVHQPTLGAALEWFPAVGTQELDDLIQAFLPGPGSIKAKRSHISLDFFQFASQTGQTFKFYPVPSSVAVPSPASSAALYDSGYASSFNASPIVSDMSPWTQSPASFAPSASFEETLAKPRSPTSKKSSCASSSAQQGPDFSNHPGMRIMTKDGRDVTNSASRGCKTKEQRDHAHLMRIIKACDACKKKKIRCDPSHKKRTAAETSPAQQKSKPAKRLKKTADPPPLSFDTGSLDFLNADSFEAFEIAPTFPLFQDPSNDLGDDFQWDQFLQTESIDLASNFVPDNYNFFQDPQGYFPSTSGSSAASPSQVFTPFTPAPPSASPRSASEVISGTLPDMSPSDPSLPYLNPGIAHGTNYVDFNLYSPASDFSLDEELLPASRNHTTASRQRSPRMANAAIGNELLHQEGSSSAGVAHADQYSVSPRYTATQFVITQSDWYPHGSTTTKQPPIQSPSATDQLPHSQRGPGTLEGLQPPPSELPQHAQTVRRSAPSKSSPSQGRGSYGPNAQGCTMTQLPSPSLGSGGSSHVAQAIAGRPADGGVYSVGDASRQSRQSSLQDYGWSVSLTPALPSPSQGVIAPATEVRGTIGLGGTIDAGGATNPGGSRPTRVSHPSVPGGGARQTVHPQDVTHRGDALTLSNNSLLPGQSRQTSTLVHAPSQLGPVSLSATISLSERVVSQFHNTISSDGYHSTGAVLASTSSASIMISALLIAILPMQLVTKNGAKRSSLNDWSPTNLCGLVAFGLVSCLLVSASQPQQLGHFDPLNILATIAITLASFALQQSRLATSRPMLPSATAAPSTTGTIGNVKSKIQGIGQRLDSLRSTVSQRGSWLMARPFRGPLRP